MTNNHQYTGSKNDTLTLKASEAHIASLSVAIISGAIGGVLAFYIPLGVVAGFIAAAILGFGSSWIVCKYLFPSAHHWYGHKSLAHRIYDFAGIVSAMAVYYLA